MRIENEELTIINEQLIIKKEEGERGSAFILTRQIF
jgi:hypothetical protein